MINNVTASQRFRILKRDNFTCQYCGRSSHILPLEVDHKVSIADGGSDDDSNLVVSCIDCNRGKRGDSIDDQIYKPVERRRTKLTNDNVALTHPRSMPLTDETWEELRIRKDNFRTWEEFMLHCIDLYLESD